MERDFTARGNLDMGGLDAGKIKQEDKDYALWEKRVDAMMVLLTNDLGLMPVAQLRKGIEALPPSAYDQMTYYERWIASIASSLLESAIISPGELRSKMSVLQKKYSKRADDA